MTQTRAPYCFRHGNDTITLASRKEISRCQSMYAAARYCGALLVCGVLKSSDSDVQNIAVYRQEGITQKFAFSGLQK